MIKKTFKELSFMNNLYNEMLKENPKIENTKFGYAFNRFFRKNLDQIFKDYNTILADIHIDNALTDKDTGEILFDRESSARGFKFSPEKLKLIMKKERELQEEWNQKEYEVEPFIATEVPSLNETQKEAFEGLIITCKEQ